MASALSTYARAFADVVFARRLDATVVLRETRALADTMASSKELQTIWEAPSIPANQKRNLLDAIVSRLGVSREVRNFLAVIIDKHRTHQLSAIIAQLQIELDRRLGSAEAEITSARELSAAEQKLLEGELEKLTGKKVRARYSRDVSLLGGAVVRLGSTIYDGSVKGQLERVREQLAGS